MWVPWRRRPPHGIHYDEVWLGSGFSNSFFFLNDSLQPWWRYVFFDGNSSVWICVTFFTSTMGRDALKNIQMIPLWWEPQSRFPGSRQGRFLHRSCIEARCHKVFQHSFQARKPKNIQEDVHANKQKRFRRIVEPGFKVIKVAEAVTTLEDAAMNSQNFKTMLHLGIFGKLRWSDLVVTF